MYGISSSVTNAPEEHFNEAMEFFNDVAVAIEQLSDISERNARYSRSEDIERDHGSVKKIISRFSKEIGLESIGLEDMEEKSGFIKVTSDVLRKLKAYILNMTEFITQTLLTHKRTAQGMLDKASRLIGEADTNNKEDSTNNVNGVMNAFSVFKELNIEGKVPTDIEKYLLRELKLSRDLSTVDYSVMISDLVKHMKKGEIPEEARLKVLNEIKDSCEKNLTKVTAGDGIKLNMDPECEYYKSEICPGNLHIVVTVPKSVSQFNKYSTDIRTTKKNWNASSVKAKMLSLNSILESSRAVKIYCDEVIKNSKNQDKINKASREINLAVRKGDNSNISSLVKDFSKLIRNPHLTHTRMCLTLCARVLKYSQACMKTYNK